MANFDIAVAKTLLEEGGSKLTNNTSDKGGLTKYGISQAAYPDLDIANLTEQHARNIYLQDYWLKCGANDIESQELAEALFDFAVNAGANTAKRLFEIAKPSATPEEDIMARFTLLKIIRYTHLCNKDATQKKWYFGWISRAIGGGQ